MNIKQISVLIARIALCIIYFWFGVLKVIGQSPASPLVKALLVKMSFLSFIPATSFVVLFGVLEIVIGILFIIPSWEKLAFGLFTFHMISTSLPLFVLGSLVWTHAFVPTLEGQYIIKNLALIACALTIAASLPSPQKLFSQNPPHTL